MTEIPRPTKTFKQMFVGSNGIWRAYYYVNGHQQRVSLRTTDETVAAARRDTLHKELLAKGARWRVKQSVDRKLLNKSSLYIHKRDPYVVCYRKRIIGSAKTEKEAIRIRDGFLETLTGK